MTALRSLIIEGYDRKARTCEQLALEHDSFGPSRFGHEYRESAKHWRAKADDIRNGGEFRPKGV